MKNNITIILISFTLFFSAHAQEELCQIPNPSLIETIDLDLDPEYFLHPFPLSNRIALAENSRNYFVDLATKTKIAVPGMYDALPMPDEKFWVFPSENGLRFMNMDQPNLPMIGMGIDKEMQGYYQSAGKLPSESRNIYRIMVDLARKKRTGFAFRDYEFSKLGENFFIKTVGPVTNLCRNITGPLSLPMLSKDGLRISALNQSTQTTNIYRIGEKGLCELELDLGIETGKVDFSYDGKFIAFHTISIFDADMKESAADGWITRPLAKMVSNAWVFDFVTKKIKQLTHYVDSSALYPAFNQKGEILVRKYRNGGVSILRLDPSLTRAAYPISIFAKSSFEKNSLSAEQDPSFLAAITLGSMLKEVCFSSEISIDPLRTLLLIGNINKRKCLTLADEWKERQWKFLNLVLQGFPTKDCYEKIQRDDIASICPEEDDSPTANANYLNTVTSPSSIISLDKIPDGLQRCIACHGGNSQHPIHFDRLEELKKELKIFRPDKPTLLEEMISRVRMGSVPPKNGLGIKELTSDEQIEIVKWLEALQAKK